MKRIVVVARKKIIDPHTMRPHGDDGLRELDGIRFGRVHEIEDDVDERTMAHQLRKEFCKENPDFHADSYAIRREDGSEIECKDTLDMHTPNLADENYRKLAALFPNAVTESIDPATGEVVRTIDRDVLMQEINTRVVEGREERYQFTWPDKRRAVLAANAPIAATLRPVRAESVGKDGTPGGFDSENLYIEGDNLDVLKLLRETYLGKVKMIYIDPPYNTGNDFVYEDDFSEDADSYMARSGQYDEQGNRLTQNTESNGRFHTDWLNMIYPRLRVAKDLLSEDGVIFISIDDNELNNLKTICNEIFGEKNFIANMIWQSTAGSNTGTDIITVTENILIYTKARSRFVFDGMLVDDQAFTLSDEYEAVRGKYSLDKLDRRRVGTHYSEALNFGIEMPDGTIRFPGGTAEKSSEGWNYLWSKSKVEWGIREGFIEFRQLNDGSWNVYNKNLETRDSLMNSYSYLVDKQIINLKKWFQYYDERTV